MDIFPRGTIVRVINKELRTYNKIMLITYWCIKGYRCHDLDGFYISGLYNNVELEILSYANNSPSPNCNFANLKCYFCNSETNVYYVNHKHFRYCPKCLK